MQCTSMVIPAGWDMAVDPRKHICSLHLRLMADSVKVGSSASSFMSVRDVGRKKIPTGHVSDGVVAQKQQRQHSKEY